MQRIQSNSKIYYEIDFFIILYRFYQKDKPIVAIIELLFFSKKFLRNFLPM